VADAPLTWPHLISALLTGRNLSRAETAWAMEQVMTNEAGPTQLAGFLVALRAKGEVVEELAGLVDVMLDHAVRIEVPGPAIDVVGTGGDLLRTVNLSTMAAIVVAGAGHRVVKHGNRASSSASGAADVLGALGVRLDLPPARVAELATEVGITFCFAQVFHPAMRFAGPVRRELGVPTAFNFLGPLTNPARPGISAIGCSDARMAPIMAGVLAARGDSALVFRGDDGLDELSTTGPSQIWRVRDGAVSRHRFDPADVGLAPATVDDLRGGDAEHNAAVVRALLDGRPGPIRDAVVLNAAAALAAAGVVDGDGAVDAAEAVDGDGAVDGDDLTKQIGAALEHGARSIDSGAAADVLERWVHASV
jgi:anthranilate phosphoribosyltransferase